jgi:hypothetical protein
MPEEVQQFPERLRVEYRSLLEARPPRLLESAL